MKTNAIELREVCKRYRGFALDRVTFDVPEGYVTGLVGPNGAGKTTLIKSIMNLTRLESGTIRVLGLDHARDEVAVKSRIGFVYDEPCFPQESTLRDIQRTVAPFYDDWDESRFHRLSEAFELPMARRFKKLSHGTQMKFALALALSHRADLLIMDEPTAGLDPVFRSELLGHLRAILQEERKTVLFSTHVTSDLERIADFLVCLHGGQIQFSTSKDELLERWAIVKGGPELVQGDSRRLFRGWHRNAYGVEALTEDGEEARRRLGPGVVVERPTIEDVMYLSTRGGNDD